jgi:hypothetical protein
MARTTSILLPIYAIFLFFITASHTRKVDPLMALFEETYPRHPPAPETNIIKVSKTFETDLRTFRKTIFLLHILRMRVGVPAAAITDPLHEPHKFAQMGNTLPYNVSLLDLHLLPPLYSQYYPSKAADQAAAAAAAAAISADPAHQQPPPQPAVQTWSGKYYNDQLVIIDTQKLILRCGEIDTGQGERRVFSYECAPQEEAFLKYVRALTQMPAPGYQIGVLRGVFEHGSAIRTETDWNFGGLIGHWEERAMTVPEEARAYGYSDSEILNMWQHAQERLDEFNSKQVG